MKKLSFTLLLLISLLHVAFSQTTNTFPTTGNAGIGTTGPTKLLHIFNATDASIRQSTTNYTYLIGPSADDGVYHIARADGVTADRLTILANGYIGLGTATPNGKIVIPGISEATTDANSGLGLLRISSGTGASTDESLIFGVHDGDFSWLQAVKAGTANRNFVLQPNGGYTGIGTNSPISTLDVNGNITTAFGSGFYFNAYYSGGFKYRANGYGNVIYQNSTGDFIVSTFANNTGGAGTAATESQKMIIQNSGNVGIGTTNTQGYKLAVNGSMIATAVTVKLYANWPDYVFKKDYRLAPLNDVKTYIDQNHHLPDMPSATEVAKNGINLGEMNKLLTKKVEELTLYMIEQQKLLKQQQQAIETENTKAKELEERLKRLEVSQKQ